MTRDEYIDAAASWLASRDGYNPNERRPPFEYRSPGERWKTIRDAYRTEAAELLDALDLNDGHPDEVVWTPALTKAVEQTLDDTQSPSPAGREARMEANLRPARPAVASPRGASRPASAEQLLEDRLTQASALAEAIWGAWPYDSEEPSWTGLQSAVLYALDAMAARPEPKPPETTGSSGGFCG